MEDRLSPTILLYSGLILRHDLFAKPILNERSITKDGRGKACNNFPRELACCSFRSKVPEIVTVFENKADSSIVSVCCPGITDGDVVSCSSSNIEKLFFVHPDPSKHQYYALILLPQNEQLRGVAISGISKRILDYGTAHPLSSKELGCDSGRAYFRYALQPQRL